MKNLIQKISFAILILSVTFCAFAGCSSGGYSLDEAHYFLTMQNMLYFPENYVGDSFEYDCFVYEIEDAISGETYICGVRKCPANFGCKCGNDSILGFMLVYDGDIPAARNQSENSNDKTWIHVTGIMTNADMTAVNIYSLDAEGNPTEMIEKIFFCKLNVETLEEIDGIGLNYYVS